MEWDREMDEQNKKEKKLIDELIQLKVDMLTKTDNRKQLNSKVDELVALGATTSEALKSQEAAIRELEDKTRIEKEKLMRRVEEVRRKEEDSLAKEKEMRSKEDLILKREEELRSKRTSVLSQSMNRNRSDLTRLQRIEAVNKELQDREKEVLVKEAYVLDKENELNEKLRYCLFICLFIYFIFFLLLFTYSFIHFFLVFFHH